MVSHALELCRAVSGRGEATGLVTTAEAFCSGTHNGLSYAGLSPPADRQAGQFGTRSRIERDDAA